MDTEGGLSFDMDEDESDKNGYANANFFRKKAERRLNWVPAAKSSFVTAGNVILSHSRSLNRSEDNLRYCTEELGAESNSCMDKGAIMGLITGVGKLHQDGHSVLKGDDSTPGVVNVSDFEASEIDHGYACAHQYNSGDGDGDRDRDTGSVYSVQKRWSAVEQHYFPARVETSGKVARFPPPISSMSTATPAVSLRSYKTSGRFVLQKVEIPSLKMFRAKRGGGRLQLELISRASEDIERPCVQPVFLQEEGELHTELENGIAREERDGEFSRSSQTGGAKESVERQTDSQEARGDSQSERLVKLPFEVREEDEMGMFWQKTIAERGTQSTDVSSDAVDSERRISPFQDDTSRENGEQRARGTSKVSSVDAFDPGYTESMMPVAPNSHLCSASGGSSTTGKGDLLTARSDILTDIANLPIGLEDGITRHEGNRVMEIARSNGSSTKGGLCRAEKMKINLCWALLKLLPQQITVLFQLERSKCGLKLFGVYWYKNLFPLDERGATNFPRATKIESISDSGIERAEDVLL